MDFEEPLLELGDDVEPDELVLGVVDELELLGEELLVLGDDVLPEAPVELDLLK